jgi:hypothetical protein
MVSTNKKKRNSYLKDILEEKEDIKIKPPPHRGVFYVM